MRREAPHPEDQQPPQKKARVVPRGFALPQTDMWAARAANGAFGKSCSKGAGGGGDVWGGCVGGCASELRDGCKGGLDQWRTGHAYWGGDDTGWGSDVFTGCGGCGVAMTPMGPMPMPLAMMQGFPPQVSGCEVDMLSDGPRANDDGTVWVGQLPPLVTSKHQVADACSHLFGAVVHVHIKADLSYGFVHFADPRSANAAVEAGVVHIYGQPVEVRRAKAGTTSVRAGADPDEENIRWRGRFESFRRGHGFLRPLEHHAGQEESCSGPDRGVYVAPSQVERFGLVDGDVVTAVIRPPRDKDKRHCGDSTETKKDEPSWALVRLLDVNQQGLAAFDRGPLPEEDTAVAPTFEWTGVVELFRKGRHGFLRPTAKPPTEKELLDAEAAAEEAAAKGRGRPTKDRGGDAEGDRGGESPAAVWFGADTQEDGGRQGDSGGTQGGNKTSLNCLLMQCVRRALTKQDVVYSTVQAEDGSIRATVELMCVEGAPKFTGDAAHKKKDAEHNAARVALEAYSDLAEEVRAKTRLTPQESVVALARLGIGAVGAKGIFIPPSAMSEHNLLDGDVVRAVVRKPHPRASGPSFELAKVVSITRASEAGAKSGSRVTTDPDKEFIVFEGVYEAFKKGYGFVRPLPGQDIEGIEDYSRKGAYVPLAVAERFNLKDGQKLQVRARPPDPPTQPSATIVEVLKVHDLDDKEGDDKLGEESGSEAAGDGATHNDIPEELASLCGVRLYGTVVMRVNNGALGVRYGFVEVDHPSVVEDLFFHRASVIYPPSNWGSLRVRIGEGCFFKVDARQVSAGEWKLHAVSVNFHTRQKEDFLGPDGEFVGDLRDDRPKARVSGREGEREPTPSGLYIRGMLARPAEATRELWTCVECGELQDPQNAACEMCDFPRHASDAIGEEEQWRQAEIFHESRRRRKRRLAAERRAQEVEARLSSADMEENEVDSVHEASVSGGVDEAENLETKDNVSDEEEVEVELEEEPEEPVPKQDAVWICSDCGDENETGESHCAMCGANGPPRPSGPIVAEDEEDDEPLEADIDLHEGEQDNEEEDGDSLVGDMDLDEGEPPNEEDCVVHVANLPTGATEEEVCEALMTLFGQVMDVRLAKGLSIGIVKFHEAADAAEAVLVGTAEIRGVEVTLSAPPQREIEAGERKRAMRNAAISQGKRRRLHATQATVSGMTSGLTQSSPRFLRPHTAKGPYVGAPALVPPPTNLLMDCVSADTWLAATPGAGLAAAGDESQASLLEHLIGHRLEGVVKSFRGSFGFVENAEVAELLQGVRDVFLHRASLREGSEVPTDGSIVTFTLAIDSRGGPKADDAQVEIQGEGPRVVPPPAVPVAPVALQPRQLPKAALPAPGSVVAQAMAAVQAAQTRASPNSGSGGISAWTTAVTAVMKAAARQNKTTPSSTIKPPAIRVLGASGPPLLQTIRGGSSVSTFAVPHAPAPHAGFTSARAAESSKVAAFGVAVDAGSGIAKPRPGTWNCSSCSQKQYANNAFCTRCGQSRQGCQ
eukprot:TRINITY_DN67250_c0_g1_i1.p1 TRINITY_DN67250_c0_g1~~TRINITY_DN67250_c0_g1_i1.p1  ORF type:complete len:1506 (+),score=323.34 TRINITY_DN67250_c0_g1_i1:74-4591(+)